MVTAKNFAMMFALWPAFAFRLVSSASEQQDSLGSPTDAARSSCYCLSCYFALNVKSAVPGLPAATVTFAVCVP
jgi:hypothetical protein